MKNKNYVIGRYSYSTNQKIGEAFQRVCGNRGKKFSDVINNLIMNFLLEYKEELDKDEIEAIDSLRKFDKELIGNGK